MTLQAWEFKAERYDPILEWLEEKEEDIFMDREVNIATRHRVVRKYLKKWKLLWQTLIGSGVSPHEIIIR